MTAEAPLKVLVTGAGGMLAHDLVPALVAAGHSVTAAKRAHLDITDPEACLTAVAGHDLVVNTAAWTAVDDAETNEAAAFAVNAVGAANIARAASAAGVRLVHVSTDYVFDGRATEPYAADAPVCPRSAYGRTKAAGEWAVRALCPEAYVLRTAWLYGAGGPNFVATMTRLARERETVSVVDDQVGQPTWTVDLADLIVRLVASSAPYGTYHGTSRGQVSWFGFTQAIFEELGLDPERVKPTTTEAFPRPAPRPLWSVLSQESVSQAGIDPVREWRAALHEFLRT
ncbi:dTDP-4-dehydrorhamnose reductase [Intrasporangium chromatireducens Q5-1]|uniref:dTDP-4-dehydrorhamnose reductase n=1 Tax=Intrasporangium chromatireducens Q5-1 TaxID=584657 RepID=W9GPH6_9MICO|nr:dTDP-4-dehydrorhamnose reductase [Intrasporangium chromatireducens]EWT06972.1 dTDP-4-dehydrorhamnose reductase [Intrasporangium chromatireducens Q5-1]